MKLKQLYTRFRDWQRNPFHFRPMVRKTHQCLNCGHEYEGNFCPCCGQKNSIGRLSWHSVFAKVFDVWDVEKNTLPATLLHLLLRPGYMLRSSSCLLSQLLPINQQGKGEDEQSADSDILPLWPSFRNTCHYVIEHGGKGGISCH